MAWLDGLPSSTWSWHEAPGQAFQTPGACTLCLPCQPGLLPSDWVMTGLATSGHCIPWPLGLSVFSGQLGKKQFPSGRPPLAGIAALSYPS